MPDIIHLLPDSVANQIAAGEVIQRPASVVKELMENAIDAGSTSISVLLKDAGRTLIQVSDNGFGMSETDARMAFERHATSKITSADDLFAICTMGFRGEALASIAAVAELMLKTKRSTDELGTELSIRATEVLSQEPINCQAGSNFSVKNLFFNVPARRKFLKSDNYELRLVIAEFQKVAMANFQIEFTFQHNNTQIYHLVPGNLRQRIVQLFGKNVNQNLFDIKTDTTIVKLSGFVGKPESAKKTYGEQFFFVNNRFMKHPFFHKAIMNAYEKILLPNTIPSYFIFFEINPQNIDVNIHPTKTEIKFEDEQAIWQILHASVKEALGKFNVLPSLDFNTEAAIDIPVFNRKADIKIPEVKINPDYNPFEDEKKSPRTHKADDYFNRNNLRNWETLFTSFENEPNRDSSAESDQRLFDDETMAMQPALIQCKNKYILTPVKSGLMFIDQKRAHERILYEKFLDVHTARQGVAQQNLFPQVIELSADNYQVISEVLDDINRSGFDIRDFGNSTIVVNGCPADLHNPDPKELVETIIEEIKSQPFDSQSKTKERIAVALAKALAIPYGKTLSKEEMRDIIDRLFSCSNPNYSPDGKPVLIILDMNEIEKRFK
jgi:DNA mismatch repair protein MutL